MKLYIKPMGILHQSVVIVRIIQGIIGKLIISITCLIQGIVCILKSIIGVIGMRRLRTGPKLTRDPDYDKYASDDC